jgi:hypothetical protein
MLLFSYTLSEKNRTDRHKDVGKNFAKFTSQAVQLVRLLVVG